MQSQALRACTVATLPRMAKDDQTHPGHASMSAGRSSMDDPVSGRRAPQWLPTARITLATPFLVWFATGESPTYSSYQFGPYDVGLASQVSR